VRNRSCPAVSQTFALIRFPWTLTAFIAKSTPIVGKGFAFPEILCSPSPVHRSNNQLFPTPMSNFFQVSSLKEETCVYDLPLSPIVKILTTSPSPSSSSILLYFFV
jgi:hypothetical protein